MREKEKEESEKKEENNENQKNAEDEACEKIINNKDYYDILGITKQTSNDDIKKAYKKLAIKFHPDKNKSPKAEEAFKKIATAYQTLTDPKKENFLINMVVKKNIEKKYIKKGNRHMKKILTLMIYLICSLVILTLKCLEDKEDDMRGHMHIMSK